MRRLFVLLFLPLLGAGCVMQDGVTVTSFDDVRQAVDEVRVEGMATPSVSLPLGEEVGYVPSERRFGEYVSDGRFTGYHVADDLEVDPALVDVPVYAIADGTVVYVDWVSGYGGVMIVEHLVAGERIRALYGHIDRDSVPVAVGGAVEQGQQIAVLGEDQSAEIDGVRAHLHFSLYRGDDIRLPGYTTSVAAVDNWVNPQSFFEAQGVTTVRDRTRSTDWYVYPDFAQPLPVRATVPAGWDVEWVPAIQSWNLYDASGQGTARERSQIFIRTFDASDFLTLQTVDIFAQEDLTIGQGEYTARRYDIEKKAGVADFASQPSWRSERHIVTDVRGEDGFTRYYVIAANPDLDSEVYEAVLASLEIVE